MVLLLFATDFLLVFAKIEKKRRSVSRWLQLGCENRPDEKRGGLMLLQIGCLNSSDRNALLDLFARRRVFIVRD